MTTLLCTPTFGCVHECALFPIDCFVLLRSLGSALSAAIELVYLEVCLALSYIPWTPILADSCHMQALQQALPCVTYTCLDKTLIWCNVLRSMRHK